MVARFRFTKAAIEKLPIPSTRTYHRDLAEPILGLSVTPNGSKSYFAAIKIRGKARRVGLGKYPTVSVPLARMKAREAAVEWPRVGTRSRPVGPERRPPLPCARP